MATIQDLNSLDDSQLSLLLDSLNREQLEEWQERCKRFLPWSPYPGPQAQAYLSDADELYFGGAAGGGKTFLHLGLSVTQHRNSLLLRRQSVDAKGITEALRSLNVGTWKSIGYGGELRTRDGRLIEVGGCQHPDDWQKYQGRAHDYIGFDELPQFALKQYQMLSAWNRVDNPVKHPKQRSRVVGAGNPPTDPEGEWVLRRWAAWLDPTHTTPARPGELRWYVEIGDEEQEVPDNKPVHHSGREYRPRSRTFIPARLEDNPALAATNYGATLDALPEPLRSMLRYGDMVAARQDDRWQLIPTRWVVDAQKRWVERSKNLGQLTRIGCDVAMEGKDWTVIAPLHRLTIGNLIKRKGRDTPDGQSVCALLIAAGCGSTQTNVDAIGIGKSAVDVAKLMNLDTIRPVVVSESSEWRDPRVPNIRFMNLRAAIMWHVRSLLDPDGGPPDTRLAIPPDPELLGDLTAPRYGMKVSGIQVESKDDIRKRIGRSTDCGDAVALACWPGRPPSRVWLNGEMI